jgi:hypothetical protein
LNEGDKKFSINQNLTFLSVFFITLATITDKKRSYKCPDATVKTLISPCGLVSLSDWIGFLDLKYNKLNIKNLN